MYNLVIMKTVFFLNSIHHTHNIIHIVNTVIHVHTVVHIYNIVHIHNVMFLVGSHVSLQCNRLNESFAAHIATMWFFAGMRHNVVLQCFGFAK